MNRPTGLNVVIDFSRPSGDRVQSIYARCGNCAVPMYEKLDLNANYTIIISSYLSEGGDGFSFKKVLEYKSFGECEANIIPIYHYHYCYHYYYYFIVYMFYTYKIRKIGFEYRGRTDSLKVSNMA